MHLFGHNLDHDYYFELLCEEERAALGGISYATIRKLITSGQLRTFRIGKHGHHRVRQSALRELLASGDQQREVTP